MPLCSRVIEIVDEARRLGVERTAGAAARLVFPSQRGKAIGDARLSGVLQQLGIGAVPHGFRSSFRDWASERTDHPREVIEAALAHVVRNQTEAAYARSELFERRRRRMDDGLPERAAAVAKRRCRRADVSAHATRMSRGDTGEDTPRCPGAGNQVGLVVRKQAAARAGQRAVPTQGASKRECRPRAKTPMNRGGNRLRRRAAPFGFSCDASCASRPKIEGHKLSLFWSPFIPQLTIADRSYDRSKRGEHHSYANNDAPEHRD